MRGGGGGPVVQGQGENRWSGDSVLGLYMEEGILRVSECLSYPPG